MIKFQYQSQLNSSTLQTSDKILLQRCRTFRKIWNLIGFVIENLSYNWSIITYRNSNTNSVGVFHCIKLIYDVKKIGNLK